MAYGFNNDRSKAPVYTKDQIDQMDLVNDQALAQEASDRATAVAAVDARVSNIIADGQQTEGNTELIDIRTGYDSTVYDTAGDAVRNNDARSFNFIKAILGDSVWNITDFEKGNVSTGGVDSAYREQVRARSKGFISFPYQVEIEGTIGDNPGTRLFYAYYSGDEVVLSNTSRQKTIPANTPIRLCFDARYGQSSDLPILSLDEILSLYTITPSIDLTDMQSDLTDMQSDLTDMQSDLTDMQSDLDDIIQHVSGSFIPDYYFEDDYLDNKALAAQKASCVDGVSFGFITDVHVADSAQQSMKLARYIKDHTSALPFMIFGGDVIPTNVGTADGLHEIAMTWQEMISQFGKNEVFQCRGNHDYLGKLSDNSSYNEPYATSETYMMRNHPFNIHRATDNSLSYYFDIAGKNTRFIVLDAYSVSNNHTVPHQDFGGYVGIHKDEITWLVNEALDINDYHIIIVIHQPLFDIPSSSYTVSNALVYLRKILAGFASHSYVNESYGASSVNKDFSNNTSELVCVLCGHMHKDLYDSSYGFLQIVNTSDALYQTDGYGRLSGTITEGAFDIFAIDYTDKTITATRIGAGNDRTWSYQ